MEAKKQQNPLCVLNAWLQKCLTSTELAYTQESLKSRSRQLLFHPSLIKYQLYLYSINILSYIFL